MTAGLKRILYLSLPLAVIFIVSLLVQAEQEFMAPLTMESQERAQPPFEKESKAAGQSELGGGAPNLREARANFSFSSPNPELPASQEATPMQIPAVDPPKSATQAVLDRLSDYFESISSPYLNQQTANDTDDLNAGTEDRLQSFSEEVVDVAMSGVGVRNGRDEEAVEPLTIVTSDIKPGVVGTPYSDTVQATGGTAPYRFLAAGLPGGFSINESSGEISGTADVPNENKLMISVIDSDKKTQRRSFDLVIRTTPIFIASSAIGEGSVGVPFFARLIAQGGRPPYFWSVNSGRMPSGLTITADGIVSGAAAEEHSGAVRIMVRDEEGGIDQADLRINIRAAAKSGEAADDSKTDEVELPPVNEDDDTEVNNGDEGNPGSTGGAGGGPTVPLLSLIAAPSDGKVGLTWTASAGRSVLIYRSATAHPTGQSDGEAACGGAFAGVTNCVDRNLVNGVTYYYSAFAVDSGGTLFDEPPVEAAATPTAVTLSGPADPFADEVPAFRPLDPACFNCNLVNLVIVGPPRGKGEVLGSFDVVSLGARVNSDSGRSKPYGGSITIRFTNNIVVNGPGVDFTVFENPIRLAGTDYYFAEPAIVEVSANGVDFYRFPFDFVPHYNADGVLNLGNPLSYAKGFAGVKPVYSNNGIPDPTRPNLSGGDQFDLSDIPGGALSWIQYVRITSTGDGWLTDMNGDIVRHSNDPPTFGASGLGNSGFDFDAIAAVNY